MIRRFVAPGKVVLLGEYAVLDGAPAIVAAVSSGVAVDVSPGALAIRTPTGDDRFVAAALHAAGAPAAHYAFSDWRPVDTAGKPGLGGSAAATVAAVLAARALRGLPLDEAPAIASLAVSVHRAVQGSGSGVDVRASVYGGVIRLDGAVVSPLRPVSPVVVYSGSSRATGPSVARYLAWRDRARFVDATRAVVDGFSVDPVAALAAGLDLLRAMAREADLPYLTPALAEIAALAEHHGGAAKPSGAGGGDVAVALFHDPSAAVAFAGACAEAGYDVLPVSVCAGAHEERP